ncbi:hypothetical protein W97_08630 [Coniosporium apollinis CBS 100218]|uniref:CASTOR ACT domain-containing protein n=1 Tax=Coniosporium apollinis (strain CBS 100218) TaxID=1168221 RepID=R7Z599_CONA1|nr:uncharacterized protein W97_08630 [Coniosporium apollinis CBS 100218]EON69370.1 hypothetical protein W97_08630 [Coniosporium apollinis CBS 100218]
MAGISIFFITTYFADYILVPHRSRTPVIKALEARGFAFDMSTSTYTNASHSRNHSSSSNETPPPGTPPPASISELQTRTFATLKRRNIVPTVDPAIRLVHCAGRRDTDLANGSRPSANRTAEDKLQLGLVKCLICTPRFLSLTLTDTEPASLLLEKRLLANFPGDDDVLLGSKDDILIPITLDLRGLPLESTGIVCGVASRLVGGTTAGLEGPVEMSYLSTARAGTVMVAEEEIERAMWALRGVDNGVHELGD